MNNFIFYAPTKICFGKGQISNLKEMADYGKKALIVYGGGSVKKAGIFDEAAGILKEAGIEIFECGGIEPNPKVESLRKGIEICRENSIDMVLAIGGGSVIDASKGIAAGTCYDGDVWDLVKDSSLIKAALPLFVILTAAATGSEMNQHAVISDLSINMKQAMHSDLLKPRISILDPTYTYSVSARQTSAGTADIMSHTLENYFTNVKGAFLQGRLCEGVLKTCIEYGPKALENPDDYEARANLMWASTWAINGLLKGGAEVEWCMHPMEHELSAFYDITHGVGLAILTPRWMEYVLSEKTARQFAEYGINVWGLEDTGDDMQIAKQAIDKTYEFFFKTLRIPSTLTEVGIDDKYFEIMAEKSLPRCRVSFVPLSKEDIINIYRACL